MTEYEIADLALSTQAILWQQLQMAQGMADRISNFVQSFSNLLFGYLIVAYFVGAQLTKVQAGILTTLYLFWLVRLVFAFNLISTFAQTTLDEMKNISPDFSPVIPSVWGMYSLLLCLTLGSLYFMWTIRHPKAG